MGTKIVVESEFGIKNDINRVIVEKGEVIWQGDFGEGRMVAGKLWAYSTCSTIQSPKKLRVLILNFIVYVKY